MPSLKAIRSRIASVKNTQKITRAMKLVAAARLRRAQEQVIAARPYARALGEVIAEVAARAGDDAHPLLVTRTERKVELIVMTSDRGLAGAFNSSVNRAAERFTYERGADLEHIGLAVIGRKGRDYLRRRKVNIVRELAGVTSPTALARAQEVAAQVIADYAAGRTDAVYLVYNEFKSAMTQKVQVERLLPVLPAELAGPARTGDLAYEPTRAEVLDALLPLHVRVQLYRALLESIASEFGARMSAMDSATNNAREMISKLSLDYNRARQATITKELLEIIGGAEALKG
ncbi:MAG: ATP synthase F1 subunit gamma [Myxococcales bacterium]|nr:ATP synthase F1 subunit gamma [Myxococcales bacterium]